MIAHPPPTGAEVFAAALLAIATVTLFMRAAFKIGEFMERRRLGQRQNTPPGPET